MDQSDNASVSVAVMALDASQILLVLPTEAAQATSTLDWHLILFDHFHQIKLLNLHMPLKS
jgi:hypothetical protein